MVPTKIALSIEVTKLVRFFLFLTSLSLAISACFITDCPNRGKRNHLQWTHQTNAYKQCTPCGRPLMPRDDPIDENKPLHSSRFLAIYRNQNKNNMGMAATHMTDHRCFGPNLCCSQSEGCFPPESTEAAVCAFEDTDPNPCKNDVPSCSSAGPEAQCVTQGLCCNPKGECTADQRCVTQSSIFTVPRTNSILSRMLEINLEKSHRQMLPKIGSLDLNDWNYNEEEYSAQP